MMGGLYIAHPLGALYEGLLGSPNRADNNSMNEASQPKSTVSKWISGDGLIRSVLFFMDG